MTDRYLLYPMNVIGLAQEIRKAVSDYKARKISLGELEEVLHHWVDNMPELLFEAGDYKPTVKKIIGARRMAVIKKLLDEETLKG